MHIEKYDPTFEEGLDFSNQRDFGGVAFATKHALGREQSAERHAVQATHQALAVPDFHAVRVAELVQDTVGVDHFRQDPSSLISLAPAFEHRR
ncbi:MAG TPA: hypothetical protein VER11_31720 [Polyangiaceae bacterium]|nr:hypothetical protein [Polyangiaceae bacterium]